jgi:Na+-transporting NADH:ubiquinone oxidoreductase subunit A
MQIIVKKGHNINLAGQPASDIETLTKPEKVGILPERIPFIKPRLKAAWGDKVKIGTPLFEDKRNPDIVFLSPGSGRIEAINFGKRRVIKEIVISLDKDEKEEQFKAISTNGIENLNRDELIDMLLKGGLGQLLRELPFRDIAN